MLILQQTLLMGIGDAGRRRLRAGRRGGAPPARRRRGRRRPGPRAPAAGAARRLRSSWWCCRGSTASRRTARLGDLLVLVVPFILSVSFLGQFVGTLVQAPRDGGPALHRHRACRCSSWSASPGRSRPSRRCCGRQASSFPARRPSTAWCASTRWARRWPTSAGTGRGCGCLAAALWRPRHRSPPGSSSAEEPPMDARPGNVCSPALAVRRGAGSRRLSSCLCATGRCAADFRHGPPDRDPHRPRDHRAARLDRGSAPVSRSARASCWRCSTIPSSAASWARRRRRGQRAGRAGPGLLRRASGGGGDLADSVRTAEANLVLAEQQNARAAALAGRISPAARSSTRARRRWPRPGRSRSEARPACGSEAPDRPPRSAPWPMRRVALAEATVADLQAKLDKTRLVAPVDGIVGIRVAELGEIVPVGKPVMTLDVGDGLVVCLHAARGATRGS